MYVESLYATLLGLLALTFLRALEDKKVVRRRVELTLDAAPEATRDPVDLVAGALLPLQARPLEVDYHKDLAKARTLLSFDVLFPESLALGALTAALESVEGVREVEVRVP